MMVSAADLSSRRNAKESTASFSADTSFVFGVGLPLSLWLLTELGASKVGSSAYDFEQALRQFADVPCQNAYFPFSRLAMISIGRRFTVVPDIERGLRITL